MATVTNAGIITRSLSSYRDLFNERLRGALGADLSVDPETPQGELSGVMALSAEEFEEIIVAASNALSPSNAAGIQLDDLGALLGTLRDDASHSTVTASLTGTPGTVIPKGSGAATTTGGDEFQTVEQVTIAGNGTASVEMRAVESGAIEASPGALTRIVTRVPGWTTVTNALAATVGMAKEADLAYRSRVLLAPGRLRRGPMSGLRSALLEAGATHLRIEENATGADVPKQGLTIPANGILCIVLGGTDADVAAAILAAKSLGVAMGGSKTVGGAKFERVSEVAVKCNITIVIEDGYPSDGSATIKTNVLSYAASVFTIGEPIAPTRFYTPVNAVPGHRITSIAFTTSSGAALPNTPDLNVLYTLAESDVEITT